MLFANSAMPCPGGTCENSPALQRWEGYAPQFKSRRDGRLVESSLRIQPSLQDLVLGRDVPGVETPGYSRMSLRDQAFPAKHRIFEKHRSQADYFLSASAAVS
jgi:hypothetical protein